MTFLSGERVELEPLDPSDLTHVDAYRESRNHPAMRATGAYETGLTTEEARERIRERRSGDSDGVPCAIRAEGEVLGWAGVTVTDDRARVAEVAYYVLPGGQGKGYATDAVRTLVAFAFAELHANSVLARLRADNDPSRRVVEKVGFTREGTRREAYYREADYHDIAIYGLLRSEWDGPASDGERDEDDLDG
ncbi:GNAT family N-acetyltransferase [Haloglomus litoreum]|uniref:GNAT family N-acetyltransferase n=1 Tax=Haloglomus litoreum TaxID=3034026 RepID=UPI0023E812ED|nr:GNAT family protein [Haloglomus sp. DT116]